MRKKESYNILKLMKIKILLLSFVLSVVVNAQDLKTIELLPPESTETSDLSFLQDELKNKQVVMLGEQTHRYGNIFEMKARIIEYLHKEMGFTTIAMESSMYDIWKINLKGFNSEEFNSIIWRVWSTSSEFQRLDNYIEKHNIKVIGFDSQLYNTSNFIEDFFNYCETQKIDFKVNEDDLGIIIEGISESFDFEEYDMKFSTYEKELKRIIKRIESLENNETNFYWTQFVKSLLATSQDIYYNTEEILTTDFGHKNLNIRDKQMADNLLSYISRNPNEKIIVWADNIHIMNDNSSITKPILKDFVSMGSYVHKTLKEKSYSLATIHANDSLFDFGPKKWYKTPIKKGSFEDKLSNLGKPYLFVTSRQKEMQLPKENRLLSFIDFTALHLDKLHDGYIFFKNATLPKKELVEVQEDSLEIQPKVNKKIAQVKAGKSIILKGQIIDKDTDTPVPFATLILEKEKIYRVADENGFFKLPIKKSLLKSAYVTISSMGFETRSILLNDLNDTTFLTPKFEALNEVVITSYLSPKTVLKKAIENKKANHPVKTFNFYRYSKILNSYNDTTEIDLELITKDYDRGYLSPYIITKRVEQIKWNKNINPKKYKYSSQFFKYRENAIRYANILHKRKYKKFDLQFIKSKKQKDEGLYIIAFKTDRNKWNYTNRGYPTKYSGRVYIDKSNFAIVKVVENWETALDENEVKEYYNYDENLKNAIRATFKEENICEYSQINDEGKYYATAYFNRQYNEFDNNKNEKLIGVFERESQLYDFELVDVEEIEYEHKKEDKKQERLNRVKYNKSFWDSFKLKNKEK